MTFDSHAHRWKRDAGHVCSRLPPSTTGAGRQAELAAPVSGETFSLDIPFHRTLSPKGARAESLAFRRSAFSSFISSQMYKLQSAVSDRRIFGASKAPVQEMNVTLFCNP